MQQHVLHKPDKTLSYYTSSAHQIYEFVRSAIISMEFQPGQLVSETGLAQQFGVSRTPVRGALVKLSAAGFVEIFPQRGTYVTKLSMEKIHEAQFIREALEVAVIKKICTFSQSSRDAIGSICENILHDQELAAQDNNAVEFQNLDDKFHQSLAINSGHIHTAKLIEAEKSHMDRVRSLSLHVQGQYKRILNQHHSIVKAIKSGSAEKSIVTMSMHLQDVFAILESIAKEHPDYFA
jgi:GntR family transcriptional regulator, rspAB operon transcriptional repressor